MYPSIFRFFFISALLIFANGCVGVNKYLVSKPTDALDEIRITQSGEIKLDGIVITIRPANAILKSSSVGLLFPFSHYESEEYIFNSSYYNGGPLSSVNYFILELIISPSNNNVIFSPKIVILRPQEGSENFPISYKKLTVQRGWYSIYYPKYFAELCHEEGEKVSNIDQPIQLSDKNDACLAIKYDVTPPDPRTSFTVQIKGLNVNGKEINVPIIKFVPGVYRYNLA